MKPGSNPYFPGPARCFFREGWFFLKWIISSVSSVFGKSKISSINSKIWDSSICSQNLRSVMVKKIYRNPKILLENVIRPHKSRFKEDHRDLWFLRWEIMSHWAHQSGYFSMTKAQYSYKTCFTSFFAFSFLRFF